MPRGHGEFFRTVPTFPYETFSDSSGTKEYKIVTDIFKRVRVSLFALQDATIWYNYTVQDKESPEIIAYKYYGGTKYHWIVLLMNKVKDPQWDWPLDEKTFNKYILNKYGSVSHALTTESHRETVELKATVSGWGYTKNDIVLQSGLIVPDTFDFSYGNKGAATSWTTPQSTKTVTLYDKEVSINEEKRSIILLRRNLLSDFVSEYEHLIFGNNK
jgi:hypothetical protein